MAWTLTTTHVHKESGRRRGCTIITGINDATAADLTDQVVLDKSTFTDGNNAEPSKFTVLSITSNVQGMTRLVVEFDRATDVLLAAVGNGSFYANFDHPYSGASDSGTGGTGDLVVSTTGGEANASFTLVIEWTI